jgi:uncharacterized membrane protein required for colicin V production
MVLWMAILMGVLFVWVCVRRGFYETAILLFNIVVSIYVAIFLAPTVASLAPATPGASSYRIALSLITLGGGCFAILHGVSFVVLTGQFHIPFPRFFDIVAAGLLGFLAGFLVLSFVALAVTAMPVSNHWLLSRSGFNRQAEQLNTACLSWCCDRVHSIAGCDCGATPTQDAIGRLFEKPRHETVSEPCAAPEPNTPPST